MAPGPVGRWVGGPGRQGAGGPGGPGGPGEWGNGGKWAEGPGGSERKTAATELKYFSRDFYPVFLMLSQSTSTHTQDTSNLSCDDSFF